jgi:hypothetical protein
MAHLNALAELQTVEKFANLENLRLCVVLLSCIRFHETVTIALMITLAEWHRVWCFAFRFSAWMPTQYKLCIDFVGPVLAVAVSAPLGRKRAPS